LLQNANIEISEADKAKAKEALLNSTIEFLLYKAKLKDPHAVERGEIEILAKTVLDAYLTHQPEEHFAALCDQTIATLQRNRELRKEDDLEKKGEKEQKEQKEDSDSPVLSIHTTSPAHTLPTTNSGTSMVFSSDAARCNGGKPESPTNKPVIPETRARSLSPTSKALIV
jgi:16S rRNA C967 or C1407 C5-methylase (RsmB/RsmF family)